MRAFYGMRNGRVVHVEPVLTNDHEEQRLLARSRLNEFDCIEIWDGPVLCVRLQRRVDTAAIIDFKSGAQPDQNASPTKRSLPSAA